MLFLKASVMELYMKGLNCLLIPFSIVFFTACGGGGGGGGGAGSEVGADTASTPNWLLNSDIDGDFIENSVDEDDDNDGVLDINDVDIDNDGLIEITSLQDLDEIRNNLQGDSFRGSGSGCPETGCLGFELTTNLDFDTNRDGLVNELDDYFDYHLDGTNKGWLPIGTQETPFGANFEGNGYRIDHLYIKRDYSDEHTKAEYLGLFAYVEPPFGFGVGDFRSTISGIILSGEINGPSEYNNVTYTSTGLLAGKLSDAQIDRVVVSGTVNAQTAGCVAGSAGHVSISNSQVNCEIEGEFVAGVFGEVWGGQVWNVDVSISATGKYDAAGISGYSPFVSVWFSSVTGELTSLEGSAGGALGYSYYGFVSGFQARDLIIKGYESAGGVIGQIGSARAVSNVVASRVDAIIMSEMSAGGVVGYSGGEYSQYDCGHTNCLSSVSKTLINSQIIGLDQNADVGAVFGYARSAQILNSHWVDDGVGLDAIGNQDATLNMLNSFGSSSDVLSSGASFDIGISGSETLYSGWGMVDHDGDENSYYYSYDIDSGDFYGSFREPLWVKDNGSLPKVQYLPNLDSSDWPYLLHYDFIRDYNKDRPSYLTYPYDS